MLPRRTPPPRPRLPLVIALVLLVGVALGAVVLRHGTRTASAPVAAGTAVSAARVAAATPAAAQIPQSPAGAGPTPTPAGSAASSGAATAPAPTATGQTPPVQAASLVPAIDRVKVSRNDTLDRIFRRLQLSLADLASMRALHGIKERLDRLRPGETLTLTHQKGELLALERRVSLEETLKVQKSAEGFHADVVHPPLENRERTVSGTIDSSLFEAMTAAGAHDQTTLALAEIFAWDIDFVLDIQSGDSFTVTYQEIYEDGKYVQDGPILAARFINQGREYLAVRYAPPDGKAAYYTPDGRSLRKAFLRAPLEFTRVSSPFNLHRNHPILNLIRAHKGTDYAAPIGTPVKAAGDGRVSFVGRQGGYGNVVQIEHTRGITTVYGHLSRFAHGLHAGAHVQQGEVIAFVGMTGLATGPHLHYEYRVNGVQRNPQTVGLPDALPIEASLREDFRSRTERLLASLYLPIGPALVAR